MASFKKMYFFFFFLEKGGYWSKEYPTFSFIYNFNIIETFPNQEEGDFYCNLWKQSRNHEKILQHNFDDMYMAYGLLEKSFKLWKKKKKILYFDSGEIVYFAVLHSIIFPNIISEALISPKNYKNYRTSLQNKEKIDIKANKEQCQALI